MDKNTQLAKGEFMFLDKLPTLTKREQVLKEAFSHVGYTEEQGNDNMFGSYFEFNKVAWCGFFCNYCYWVGGAIPCPTTNTGKRGLAYVPKALEIFIKNNCITKEPQQGDLVIFDFPGGVNADHIGVFHKYGMTKETFYAIEGNTSFDDHNSQSNGGAVAYKLRNIKFAKAFICLDKINACKFEVK